jgi:hypothetical protein
LVKTLQQQQQTCYNNMPTRHQAPTNPQAWCFSGSFLTGRAANTEMIFNELAKTTDTPACSHTPMHCRRLYLAESCVNPQDTETYSCRRRPCRRRLNQHTPTATQRFATQREALSTAHTEGSFVHAHGLMHLILNSTRTIDRQTQLPSQRRLSVLCSGSSCSLLSEMSQTIAAQPDST